LHCITCLLSLVFCPGTQLSTLTFHMPMSLHTASASISAFVSCHAMCEKQTSFLKHADSRLDPLRSIMLLLATSLCTASYFSCRLQLRVLVHVRVLQFASHGIANRRCRRAISRAALALIGSRSAIWTLILANIMIDASRSCLDKRGLGLFRLDLRLDFRRDLFRFFNVEVHVHVHHVHVHICPIIKSPISGVDSSPPSTAHQSYSSPASALSSQYTLSSQSSYHRLKHE